MKKALEILDQVLVSFSLAPVGVESEPVCWPAAGCCPMLGFAALETLFLPHAIGTVLASSCRL
jgi:hypothetical protein